MDEKLVGTISQYRLPTWEVYVDRASNQKGLGVGLVLISPEKIVIEKSLRLDFSATNNEAEYEALLEGMAMVQRMGGKSIKLFSDSRLVIGQVRGEFEAKDERMQGYLSQVKFLQLNSIMPPYPLGEGGAALEPRYMTGVPPTVMPKGSIPGNGHTVHLQLR